MITINAARKTQQEDDRADNDLQKDKLTRMIFEINFDQENRIRTLEGKPAITKWQYLVALKNQYKALP